MKTKIRRKNQNLQRVFLDRLRAAAKMFWSRLEAKGKSFQPFPNEAPH